jgi:hypothetical protein
MELNFLQAIFVDLRLLHLEVATQFIRLNFDQQLVSNYLLLELTVNIAKTIT